MCIDDENLTYSEYQKILKSDKFSIIYIFNYLYLKIKFTPKLSVETKYKSIQRKFIPKHMFWGKHWMMVEM